MQDVTLSPQFGTHYFSNFTKKHATYKNNKTFVQETIRSLEFCT